MKVHSILSSKVYVVSINVDDILYVVHLYFAAVESIYRWYSIY